MQCCSAFTLSLGFTACSDDDVERTDNTYTVTIPSFDIRYIVNEGKEQYGKTSLTYKGKITWEKD